MDNFKISSRVYAKTKSLVQELTMHKDMAWKLFHMQDYNKTTIAMI